MSSVVISGDTSGAITVAAPAVAGTNTITLPALTGTMMVNGPAFGASDAATTATAGVATLISFDTEIFDTDNAFNGSRFQPLVAGYYQVNGSASNSGNASASSMNIAVYKNGSAYASAVTYYGAAFAVRPNVSTIVYLNGSTDYIELYGLNNGNANFSSAFFSASLVRGA
jgi:hypothetical protein